MEQNFFMIEKNHYQMKHEGAFAETFKRLQSYLTPISNQNLLNYVLDLQLEILGKAEFAKS